MKGLKIGQLLSEGTHALASHSPSARLDAEILLAHAIGCQRLELLMRNDDLVTEAPHSIFNAALLRRAKREPIAYITGVKEFFGLTFKVSSDVLIPRPETEHLVEQALEFAKSRTDKLRIVDLGTGSGCIGISLAKELLKLGRQFELTLCDWSAAALSMAESNAKALGVAEVCRLVLSDWFSALQAEKFDLILSNPPYISAGDPNLSPETSYEPQQALFAGEDGLAAYRQLIPDSLRALNPGGAALFEIGSSQSEELIQLCSTHGLSSNQVMILPDLAELPRVLFLRK